MDVTNIRVLFQVELPLLFGIWKGQSSCGSYLLAQTKFFKRLTDIDFRKEKWDQNGKLSRVSSICKLM